MAWPGMYGAGAHFDSRRLGDDGSILPAAVAQHTGKTASAQEQTRGSKRQKDQEHKN